MTIPRTILVPVDLGDHAAEVIDYAIALAARLDAKVHVLHVVPFTLIGSEIPITATATALDEDIARRRQEADQLAASYAGRWVFGSVELHTGDARSVITAVAERLRVDLIVMGTHGRRGVARLVLGSVAEQVTRTAPCPVLLVRSGTPTRR